MCGSRNVTEKKPWCGSQNVKIPCEVKMTLKTKQNLAVHRTLKSLCGSQNVKIPVWFTEC